MDFEVPVSSRIFTAKTVLEKLRANEMSRTCSGFSEVR